MNKYLIIILLLLGSIGGFSQNKQKRKSVKEKRHLVNEKQNSVTKKQDTIIEKRHIRPAYIVLTSGVAYSHYRDFATSPLFYSGLPIFSSISRLKSSHRKETDYGITTISGNYLNTYNNHLSASTGQSLSFYFSQLYKIDRISSEKINIKIGGMFDFTTNIRINEDLQNNALGLELFPAFFGSIKFTNDISRKKPETIKFLNLKFKLKARTRKLSYRMDIGLLNSTFRNKYAYTGHGAVFNQIPFFVDYEYHTFSGFRMNTAIDYTIHLKNKNLIQISYLWNLYKTGGQYDKFEMAYHIIKVSFLFNTNNK